MKKTIPLLAAILLSSCVTNEPLYGPAKPRYSQYQQPPIYGMTQDPGYPSTPTLSAIMQNARQQWLTEDPASFEPSLDQDYFLKHDALRQLEEINQKLQYHFLR